MKYPGFRHALAVCLALALLLSVSVPSGSLASVFLVEEEPSPFTGVISLDVNPSIELTIVDGIITQALAFNDEGQNLLTGSLAGLTPEEAVRALTRALVEGGYLAPGDTAPCLVITVTGGQDEDTAEDLKHAARQMAEELGAEFDIRSAMVSDEVAALAAAAGLSVGKYLLMEYIAALEGITLEEAIALYGAAPIGELLEQFKDARDLFDGDGPELTDEQRVALNAAFDQLKESVGEAESAFHDAFKALKSTYRGLAHSTIKEHKGGDAQALADALNLLKAQFMAEFQAIRQAKDTAIAAARAAFLEAVTAAGIPEEAFARHYAWHSEKELNFEGELNAFLEVFTPGSDEEPDEDENEDENENENEDEGENGDENKDKDHDKDNGKGKGRRND